MLWNVSWMVFEFGLHVGLMRFFSGLKQPEILLNSRKLYPSLPFITDSFYADETSFVFGRIMHILRVDGPGHISQIFKLIVGRIAIFVVYVTTRPLPHDVEPRQSVSKMANIVNANVNVAVSISCAGDCSGFNNGRDSGLNEPSKYSSARIVMHKLFQSLLGKRRLLPAHLSFSYNDGSGSASRGRESSTGASSIA